MIKAYSVNVIFDPFSVDVVQPIKQALLAGRPLSVVRIGDGEANILSYGAYHNTPCLNHYVVERIIAIQKDCFMVDSFWMAILRDLMMGDLLQADIIGVIGFWFLMPYTTEDLEQHLLKDKRRISGHWRAMDYMIGLAHSGYFKNKTIASAHLYFSLLENLDPILPCAKKIFILLDG